MTSSSPDNAHAAPTAPSSLAEHGGWPGVLGELSMGNDIDTAVAEAAMQSILAGEASDAQIAGFIMSLRIKGESPAEMTGLVRAMQQAATPLPVADDAIDIVGVGGAPSRRSHALNVSTMASLVAAAAGARICKHGNRKASSTSGSFDLLEALGVQFDVTPEVLSAGIADAGVGFAFARTFHPAMRFVAGVRTELGVPTVFNLIGPLSNPGRVTRQVIGVADAKLGARMVEVLKANGSVHAMVVTGHDQLDEFTTTGPTTVHELQDGVTSTYEVTPESVGLSVASPDDLVGGDAAANATIALEMFGGAAGPKRDIVVLNAAAGLVVAGIAEDLRDGIARSEVVLDSGAVLAKLDELRAYTNA